MSISYIPGRTFSPKSELIPTRSVPVADMLIAFEYTVEAKYSPLSAYGSDINQLYAGECLEGAPQEALTTGTASTAGATYTATEQAMINNLKTRVAELEEKMQSLGLIK